MNIGEFVGSRIHVMAKTEVMRPTNAVIETLAGVDFTCSSGNRPLDHALVDRRLESVVTVGPFWSVPWKSHVGLGNQFSFTRGTNAHARVCTLLSVSSFVEDVPRVRWVGVRASLRNGLWWCSSLCDDGYEFQLGQNVLP